MRSSFKTFFLLLCFFGMACSQAQTSNQLSNQQDNPMVIISTNYGDITLELDSEKAPNTVANFLSYVNDGHYDGTIFHRVISNFMIQGGGFEPGMQQKDVKEPIQNEANNGLNNDHYTVAMARTGDPHSATAQFFINVKDNDFLNYSSETTQGWGYAVFGKVAAGREVVEEIKAVETGQRGPFGDVPVEDIVINSIKLTSES